MPKALPLQLKELEAKADKTADDLKKIEELKAKIANKGSKTPEKPKAGTEIKKEEIKAPVKAEEKPKAPKPKETPKPKFKEGESDFVDYQRFATFYHLMWDKKQKRFLRKKLKEGVLKEYDKLEKKFKDYPGHKPKFTKTVFLEAGISNARIVENYAVPETLYNQFKDAKKSDHYF